MKKEIRSILMLSVLALFTTAEVSASNTVESVASLITPTSAQVNWMTDIPGSSGQVMFGTVFGMYPFSSTMKCSNTPLVATTTFCVNLMGLQPNTTYYYKTMSMQAAAGGIPMPGNGGMFTTLSFAGAGAAGGGDVATNTPPAPINTPVDTPVNTAPLTPNTFIAQVSQASSTVVYLSWKDTSSDETKFEISRVLVGGTTSLLPTLQANTLSYVDTGISRGGTYVYTLKSCKELLCSNSVSSTVTVTFPSVATSTPQTPTPPGPANVNVTFNNTPVVTPVTATTAMPIISINIDSAPATTTTNNVVTVPSAPMVTSVLQLLANGKPTNTLRISWRDTSSNEVSFKIYRSSAKSSALLPVIPSNTQAFDDVNLIPGFYTYYVSACNTAGCSAAVVTPPVEIPETVTESVIVQEVLTSPTDISRSFGKVMPGSFVSIISGVHKYSAVSLQDGSFTVQVPDGSYTVEAFTLASYPSIVRKSIIVSGGRTSSATEQSVTGIKKIIGKVMFSSGSLVTDAEVGAYKKETGEWVTGLTSASGTYSLIVTPGNWEVSVRPSNPATNLAWEPSLPLAVSIPNDTKDEIKDVTISVVPVASDVTISVTDESGKPLAGIGIVVDTFSSSPNQVTTSATRKTKTVVTGLSGSATIRASVGTYYVRTVINNSLPYLEAPEQKIVLTNNQVKNISFSLKKETSSPMYQVSGVTKFDDGRATNAFVSAWSNEGNYAETKSASTGNFSLNLTANQTWHIKATKDEGQVSYTSDEQTLTGVSGKSSLEIVFIKDKASKLSPVASVKNNVTEQSILIADNGTKFSLPPNAVTASGVITTEIKPTSEALSRVSSAVMGKAYDITIRTTSGQNISKLDKEAEITIPYDEAELKAKGVAVENIIPSYYDEVLSTWVSVTDFTINKEKKIFVLRVKHLTRFALIAAADTIAPSSPTNIVTDAITPTDVRISWKNPTTDFNHSKVYRSEKLGTFGQIVAAEVFSNSFIDTTPQLGSTSYYYTVRAVDAAGNESTNSTQVAITTVGTTLATTKKQTSLLLPPGQASTGAISRLLSLGSKGDDVTSLQKALKFDGFYATGPITGYFGKKTENAVFRFQNYYKEELLIPNGYKIGTGVVGAITRKKINEIIVTSGQ